MPFVPGAMPCLAEECHQRPCGGPEGWRAAYESYGLREVRYRAIVWLFVAEVDGGTYSGYAPFLVDTGTPITVIPRPLVGDNAFKGGTNDVHSVSRIGGDVLAGRRCRAALALIPPRPQCRPLQFANLNVIVCDAPASTWALRDFGLLGLDALRQIVVTFDRWGIRFEYRPEA
jgi:hypothetical protein